MYVYINSTSYMLHFTEVRGLTHLPFFYQSIRILHIHIFSKNSLFYTFDHITESNHVPQSLHI